MKYKSTLNELYNYTLQNGYDFVSKVNNEILFMNKEIYLIGLIKGDFFYLKRFDTIFK